MCLHRVPRTGAPVPGSSGSANSVAELAHVFGTTMVALDENTSKMVKNLYKIQIESNPCIVTFVCMILLIAETLNHAFVFSGLTPIGPINVMNVKAPQLALLLSLLDFVKCLSLVTCL